MIKLETPAQVMLAVGFVGIGSIGPTAVVFLAIAPSRTAPTPRLTV